ncbi:AQJ64_40280 family protein [Streptomyces adelaidensis]|uniref:AQJ64_40280 family protein n=1 Tax=Streptomyces adelaidensis TaxID=2796465 RepID=UPI00190867C0|nr:AQJ64_40280 family protein [Streptomyces adelaidensis]
MPDVEWVDARERLPRSGMPVAAATAGRYPPDDSAAEPDGEDFWLVLPTYFTARHIGEDGTEYRDCFVDSDEVVRLPHGCGRPCAEPVTHWAELPTLPGMTVHTVLGEDARTALRDALG